MKQKLFLLMVLMTGLVACSKDDDTQNVEFKDKYIGNEYGEFEGDWILNNVKIGSDTLTVMDEKFFVRVPSETLIKFAANKLYNPIQYGEENQEKAEQSQEIVSFNIPYPYVKVQTSNDSHIWSYDHQGYSNNNTYFNFYSSNTTQKIQTNETLPITGGSLSSIGDPVGNPVTWWLSINTDKPMVAIFDRKMGLWTLKIILNKIFYHKEYEIDERIMDLQSPAELLFVATKKLEKTETE